MPTSIPSFSHYASPALLFPMMLLCSSAFGQPGFKGAVAEETPPRLEVGGFAWAENLSFDGLGNLFVSDSETGEIWRIWLSGETWVKERFFGGMHAVGGLAIDRPDLYAAARTEAGDNLVIRVPLGSPTDNYEIVATLDFPGNGLELGPDGSLYVTTEGLFLPGTGAVYRITPDGDLEVFLDHLFGTNGIAIDPVRGLLYVTETLNSKVLVVNLEAGRVIERISLAGTFAHSILDDICLDSSGLYLYLADFGRGELLELDLRTRETRVITSDVSAPTSALFGFGPTFNETSLYVTEAGGLVDKDQEQRVLEVPM